MSVFFDVIKQGDKYLHSWPKQRVLNCLFIDSKITHYTRLAIAIMPAFLVLAIALNVLFADFLNWSVTVTFIFFMLGLPLQGLYWLGKRSRLLLPEQLLPWYAAIHKKLHSDKIKQNISMHRPSYFDLALLLTNAFRLGGDDFLQQHELI